MYFSAAHTASAAIKLTKNARTPVATTVFMHTSLGYDSRIAERVNVSRVPWGFHKRLLDPAISPASCVSDPKPGLRESGLGCRVPQRAMMSAPSEILIRITSGYGLRQDRDPDHVRQAPRTRAETASALARLALRSYRSSRDVAGHRSWLRHRALFRDIGCAFWRPGDRLRSVAEDAGSGSPQAHDRKRLTPPLRESKLLAPRIATRNGLFRFSILNIT